MENFFEPRRKKKKTDSNSVVDLTRETSTSKVESCLSDKKDYAKRIYSVEAFFSIFHCIYNEENVNRSNKSKN